MKTLEQVRNQYGLLRYIRVWFDEVAADVPPAHRDQRNRVVADDDLLEDAALIVMWAEQGPLRLGPESLAAFRRFENTLLEFCTKTPPTREQWDAFAAEVAPWKSRGEWAHGLTQEEYELVHYWSKK